MRTIANGAFHNYQLGFLFVKTYWHREYAMDYSWGFLCIV